MLWIFDGKHQWILDETWIFSVFHTTVSINIWQMAQEHTIAVNQYLFIWNCFNSLSSSGPGPGQVRVRKIREIKTQGFGPEPYNKIGFHHHHPPTHHTNFFLAFKGSRQVHWTQDGLIYLFHRVESFQMDSGRGNMGQEWSGVVSA